MSPRPRRLPRELARLAVAVVLVVAAAGCGDDAAPDDFSAETRSAMVTGCAEDDADPDLREVCECTYERMEDDLGFDEFADLDRRLAGGDDRLPAEVVSIIRDCIREVSATR